MMGALSIDFRKMGQTRVLIVVVKQPTHEIKLQRSFWGDGDDLKLDSGDSCQALSKLKTTELL